MKTMYFLLSLALASFTSTALSRDDASKAAAEGLLDVTVYLDVNMLARKHGAAKNLTELHQEYAQYGYRLINLSPYVENGDLQGFYVSYKKSSHVQKQEQ